MKSKGGRNLFLGFLLFLLLWRDNHMMPAVSELPDHSILGLEEYLSPTCGAVADYHEMIVEYRVKSIVYIFSSH